MFFKIKKGKVIIISTGKITVSLTSLDRAQPITDANITISDSVTNRVVARIKLENSPDGKTEPVSVSTPDPILSLIPENDIQPYTIYNISVKAPGYYDYLLRGVQVFPDRTALSEISLLALPENQSSGREIVVDIPIHQLFASTPPLPGDKQEYDNSVKVLSKVVIPEYVTVHLGRPTEQARNVTVSFPSYIKNVCCSEIYSTWPEEAIKANILAQTSLVLNRIYTEWYRSRGYNFDITNSTAFDQYFVYGRNIDENISRMVDELFTTYVRRKNNVNPYYTEYCDGRTVSCPGMKQWGTVTLANNGYTALQILQYYYGSDIELAKAEVVTGVPESYPGYSLSVGSSGADVSTIQRQLARIAQNYPSIPIPVADGTFGTTTANAVKEFQRIFNLTPDGVVGEATWYKISFIYVAVKKLAELQGEGETYAGDGIYPGSPLSIGSRGSSVSSLQYYLRVIANAVDFISSPAVDGIFGNGTATSVRQFQSLYGLVVDGIVGRETWNEIYRTYRGIISKVNTTSGEDYPGTPLRIGSRGDSVTLMQRYLNEIRTLFTEIPYLNTDGIFGSGTAAAVRTFQGLFGLSVDGVIGKNTWDRIVNVKNGAESNAYGGTALRVGSRGDEVRKLQTLLNYVGNYYYSIPKLSVDGIFGEGTRAAVLEAQRIFGLTRDGIAGRRTWNALVSQYLQILYNPDIRSPRAVLVPGSEGEEVVRLQKNIQTVSEVFPTVGSVIADGYFGEFTESAVKEIQRLFGLSADGIAGEDTLGLIETLVKFINENRYTGTALFYGISGDRVAELQGYLNSIGTAFPSIPRLIADGIFGNFTKDAVIAFQNTQDIAPDGVVGKGTWYAILRQYSILNFSNKERTDSMNITNSNQAETVQSDIYPGEPLCYGCKGINVMKMQKYITKISDFYSEVGNLVSDGIFGRMTEIETTNTQKLFGLLADGEIGENTWNMIVILKNCFTADTYGGRALSSGASGSEVLKLQSYLNSVSEKFCGIPYIDEDGKFGSATKNSVCAFQSAIGLKCDGIVGKNTWNSLVGEYWLYYFNPGKQASDPYPGVALRVGSRGANVFKMQRYLNIISGTYRRIGYIVEDGKFGEKTRQSTVRFQNMFGLSADGVIGRKTWEMIVRVKNGLVGESSNESVEETDSFKETDCFEELSLGSKGENVTALQKIINKIADLEPSVCSVEENGIFGLSTRNAVISLQKLLSAEESGTVCKEFFDELNNIM